VEDAALMRIWGDNAAAAFDEIAKADQIEWRPVLPDAESPTDNLFLRIHTNMERAAALSESLKRRGLSTEVARIIEHGEHPAAGLRNELVVRFRDDVTREEAEELARVQGLQVTREVRHLGNGFVLVRDGQPSYAVLDAAHALLRSDRVVFVEPDLIVAIAADQLHGPLWEDVPHLQLIRADVAWNLLAARDADLRGGSPEITIGVVDIYGISPDHHEFTADLSDGTGKLVTSMNFSGMPFGEQIGTELGGKHGTQCAGSATAAFDDDRGFPGVAPNCHLIGARVPSGCNLLRLADVLLWMGGFLNGSEERGFPAPPERGADVISLSIGYNCGAPELLRAAVDHLTTNGRDGKGCVICVSIGNKGHVNFTAEGLDYRDLAAYEKTIAVGASINVDPTTPISSRHRDPVSNRFTDIDVIVDTRSLYSPYGDVELRKPDLVAPSSTAERQNQSIIDPIHSVVHPDRYERTFGGTSHSTPTVAGAVALILSAGPELSWVQVREILRKSCVRIDAAQAHSIGEWQDLDGDGDIDFSRWYGAGRLDVAAAVELALHPSPLTLPDAYAGRLDT
jgi:subtilisin family serine protease